MAVDGSILGRPPGEPRAEEAGSEEAGAGGSPDAPRRSRSDRRSRPTPRISRYSFLGGRRGDVRREEEREGSFVDVYRPSVVLAVVLIALLNVGDSFFTLHHLQAGGIELNPVAERLLRTGRLGFVGWKSAIIGVALVVLLLHKNFALARLGLWVSAGAYGLLVGYHLYLLTV